MWHDSEDRLGKAVERFEEGAVEAARIMLRNLERRGVLSPRIDLYLGHCHLDTTVAPYRAADRLPAGPIEERHFVSRLNAQN